MHFVLNSSQLGFTVFQFSNFGSFLLQNVMEFMSRLATDIVPNTSIRPLAVFPNQMKVISKCTTFNNTPEFQLFSIYDLIYLFS